MKKASLKTIYYTYTHVCSRHMRACTHIFTYIYIYILWACVCVPEGPQWVLAWREVYIKLNEKKKWIDEKRKWVKKKRKKENTLRHCEIYTHIMKIMFAIIPTNTCVVNLHSIKKIEQKCLNFLFYLFVFFFLYYYYYYIHTSSIYYVWDVCMHIFVCVCVWECGEKATSSSRAASSRSSKQAGQQHFWVTVAVTRCICFSLPFFSCILRNLGCCLSPATAAAANRAGRIAN